MTAGMTKWVIDTDILIDYLRGIQHSTDFLAQATKNSLCVLSTITVAELYSGVREGKERPILDEFIKEFQIISLNEEIAQRGGLYKRDYGKSHGVGLADALIAATALYCDAHLATLNKKHYPMLKNIRVPYKKYTSIPVEG
jgi:predicted nucleic acid-binding protein